MKKIFLVSMIFISLITSAQKGAFQSNWFDSKSNDPNLTADKFTCNKKTTLCYYISNDDENIILNLRVTDAGIQNKILKEGMIVWISTDGKLTKTTGVKYPIGSERMGGRPGSIPKFNADGSIITPLAMANTIELIGFAAGEGPQRFPSENADSFSGSVKYDKDGVLVYKLVMPVTKLALRNSKDSGKGLPFTLGVEYGPTPTVPRTPPPLTSGAPSGRGGRGGGGSRGGGGGMPSGGMGGPAGPSVQQSVIVWIKDINLATAK